MGRYKCKKTYCNNHNHVTLRTISIVFQEGGWYEGSKRIELSDNDNDRTVYNIDINRRDNMSSTYTFSPQDFEKYFYTVDELREIEINKII